MCNHNPDTVVLCHINRAGVAGISKKAADWIGCWGCSTCHAWIDGGYVHDHVMSEMRDSFILDGLVRTLNALWEEGVLP